MSDVGQLNVRVGMDSSGFQNGISNLNREMKRVQSEFQLASSTLGKHGSELDKLRVNADRLTRQTELQRQKVDALEAAHQKSVDTKGADARATQELEIKLNKAKATLNGMEHDLKSLNQEIVKQESNWYKLGKSLEPVGKKMQDIGKSMQSLGKDLTTKVTLPIVGLGAAAVKVGMDFEAGMSQVAAISGATGDELEALTALAKEMGATTKFSASQSAEAMNYMAMAGWDTSQMLEGLNGIMMLAAASGESLASVSDIVTDALTAFGMSAGESADFADLLANTASSANVTVATMGETFKYAAPLFGALGYSAEDAAMAIGLMGNAGIKGSQAGTALRGALTSLANPVGETAGLMEELGLSITDANGDMKPFKEVMDDLRQGFSGLDEAQQAQAASIFFGQNAMSGILAIINASDADYAKLTEATREYSGAAGEVAEIMEDNLQGQLTKLKSALEGVGIQIFEILVPHLNVLVEALMRAVAFFAALPEPVQTALIAVAGLAAALGPLVFILGSIVAKAGVLVSAFAKLSLAIAGKSAAIGGATKAAGMLAVAKGTLGAAIAAISAPVAIAVAAFAALVAAGYLIVTNWETIKEVGEAVFQWIGEAFSNTVDWMGERLEALVDWFAALPERLREGLAQTLEGIQTTYTQMKDVMAQKVQEGIDFVVASFQALPLRVQEHFTALLNRLAQFAQELFAIARQAGQDLAKGIMDPILNLPNRVRQGLEQVASTLRQSAGNLFSAARNAGSRLTAGWRDGMGERSPSYIERSMTRIVGVMDDSVAGITRQFHQLDNLRVEPVMQPVVKPMGGSSTGETSGPLLGGASTMNITISQLHVREEGDIEKIARRLYELENRRKRGV